MAEMVQYILTSFLPQSHPVFTAPFVTFFPVLLLIYTNKRRCSYWEIFGFGRTAEVNEKCQAAAGAKTGQDYRIARPDTLHW